MILEMYITGIIQNHKHKLLAIGSMPDHIHIFIGYYLGHLIPDLVEEIKTSSNARMNDPMLGRFVSINKNHQAFNAAQKY